MMDGKKALVWMLLISCIALGLLLALAVIHRPRISPRQFSGESSEPRAEVRYLRYRPSADSAARPLDVPRFLRHSNRRRPAANAA